MTLRLFGVYDVGRTPSGEPLDVPAKLLDGERKAQAEVARLREVIAEVAKWRESSYGGVLEIMEFASEALVGQEGR